MVDEVREVAKKIPLDIGFSFPWRIRTDDAQCQGYASTEMRLQSGFVRVGNVQRAPAIATTAPMGNCIRSSTCYASSRTAKSFKPYVELTDCAG